MNVISRRQFLKAGGVAALGLSLGPTILLRPALAARETGRRRKVFVHLFQRGGAGPVDRFCMVGGLRQQVRRQHAFGQVVEFPEPLAPCHHQLAGAPELNHRVVIVIRFE